MKKERIRELFTRFENARYEHKGIDCWSARELQDIFGYTKWTNFLNVIKKAKTGCESAGAEVSDHFADVTKLIDMPKGAQRGIGDLALTRYACYLIAQNGDASKAEIAFAQTYFAVQTRKQEIIEQRLLDVARVAARVKLTKSEKKLSGIIYERGVDHHGFAAIRSFGDQALFGGNNTSDMKHRLQIPDNRPLADFLPTLTIKAKDFASELTSHNVIEKDLRGEYAISVEHVDNNVAVRKMLLERGVKPEELPPGEDLKKVQRRLEDDKKKVMKGARKKLKGKRGKE